MKRIALALVLVLLAVVLSAQSPGWPQKLGPNGNNVSLETGWNPSALAGGAKVLWSFNVGSGYSSVAVLNNRLYTQAASTKRNFTCTFTCLDATTGEVIWQKDVQSFSFQANSTPATDGERVYGLTSDADLCCLQAKDGAILWKRNIPSDYNVPAIGFASAVVSPVLEGDLVLFNASFAQIAVDKLTGDLKWKHDDPVKAGKSRPGSSATPVVCDVGGKRCVLFLGGETASLLEVATGNKLWSFGFDWDAGIIADPIVSNGRAYIFQRDVCYCLDLTKDSSKPVWQSDAFPVPFVAPVLVDGYLYGSCWPIAMEARKYAEGIPDLVGEVAASIATPQSFRCVDAATGKIVWQQQINWASPSAAGGKLLLMEIRGKLHICQASPSGWSELSSADVLAGVTRLKNTTWMGEGAQTFLPNPPVLVAGKIYCRNNGGELVCIDVSK